jgi:thymidylate synthase (FAD)
MNVNLISVTTPLDKSMTAEDFIVYTARVSNPTNQALMENNEKLLKYLIQHKHWSPFEMVNACIEINTTRDIARQILRHRSFSFQEFSQRYAQASDALNYREVRMQDKNNRQNSIELPNTVESVLLQDKWTFLQENVYYKAYAAYEHALEQGIAKEVARALLPEGLTSSKLYMSGSLRSWIHYCQLRMAHGTQKEHQEIAKQCFEELSVMFPITMQAIKIVEGNK